MRIRVRAELPTGEQTRPRGAVLAIAGVVVLALAVTLRIAFLERTIGDYSATEIVHSLDAIYIEAIAVALILWRRGGSVIERCVVLGLFAIALWPLLPVLLSHADFVETSLVTWHMLLGAWLVAFAIGAALVRRYRPEREMIVRPPRPRGWRIVAAGVLVITAWAAHDIVVASQHARSLDSHALYVSLATLIAVAIATLALIGSRFELSLPERCGVLVVVMCAFAVCVIASKEPILEEIAPWCAYVALWLGIAILAIKLHRAGRELLARYRRPF